LKAIILAAGRGNRLQPASQGTPKCMVQVGEYSIMHHQLRALKKNDITEVVMVVGYKQEAVKSHAKEISGIHFTFVENPDFATTNTAYSLLLCKEHMIEDDFFYLNADVLFHPELIRRLLASDKENVLALDNKKCGAEEVKAIVAAELIRHVGKKLDLDDSYGEFIGIGKFAGENGLRFVELLDYTVNDQKLKNEYFEYALNLLVKEVPFNYIDISDIPCIEIDFPEDLDEAVDRVLPAIRKFGQEA